MAHIRPEFNCVY